MTISLLLVVMMILTVTTRSKLEILPVSGAPAAQHAWGWHRLALPAFIPAPSHEPVWNTQALPGLEMPPDLTLLPVREQGVCQSRERVSPSLRLLQESSTRPCALQRGGETAEEEDGEDTWCQSGEM